MAVTLDQIESSLQVGNMFMERILTAIQQTNDAARSGATADAGAAAGGGGISPLALLGIVSGVVLSLQRFADALDPSTMEQFSLAIRNVFAVIGQALVPLFQVLSVVLGQVAGALDEAFRSLGPIFAELGNILGSIIVPIVQVFAALLSVLAPLLPLLQILGNIIEFVALGLKVLAVVIEAVIKFIAGLFGSSLKDAAGGFKKLLESMANAILIAIGSLLKFIGATDTLASLVKALQPQAAGVQAAGQVSFRDFQDVQREVALKAAAAQSGPGGDNKLDLSEAINELVAIQSEDASVLEEIRDAVQEIIDFFSADKGDTLTAGLKFNIHPTGAGDYTSGVASEGAFYG